MKANSVKTQTEEIFKEINRLYSVLCSRILGQEELKKVISSTVSCHFDKINNKVKSNKSNILIVGPTGSGKTEVARVVAEASNRTLLIIDCSKISPTGFVGSDAASFVGELYDLCGRNLDKVKNSIVFLDEIDKLALCGNSEDGNNSKKVMAEFLKLVEGQTIIIKKQGLIPGQNDEIAIDTSNILFIAAGAFADMNSKTDQNRKIMGLERNEKSDEFKSPLLIDKLKAQGVMPELLGRFPIIVETHLLSKKDYVSIITDSKHSEIIEYYKELFQGKGSTICFEPCFYEDIADTAIKNGLGARALGGLIDAKMTEYIFKIDEFIGHTVTISASGYKKVKNDIQKEDVSVKSSLKRVFSSLTDFEIRTLIESSDLSFYPGDKILTHEEVSPGKKYLLLDGEIKITDKSGLNIIVNEPNHVIEIAKTRKDNSKVRIYTKKDSSLLELNEENLSMLSRDLPKLVEFFKSPKLKGIKKSA